MRSMKTVCIHVVSAWKQCIETAQNQNVPEIFKNIPICLGERSEITNLRHGAPSLREPFPLG